MDKVQLNGHKRAVIYARVSTDEQADKGYSLPSQIEECGKYAHDNGFEVVGGRYFDKKARILIDEPNENTLPFQCFTDDYTGTVPIEQRPEGKRAYKMLADGGADALIIYSVDRLVRPPQEGDEWEMPILIRGLAKLNKEIHVCNRGQLKTDFASLLIAMLDAKSAGDERRKIIERTVRGRNRKAKDGKVIGSGKPPYGYRYAYETTPKGKLKVAGLEIIEIEAVIIRLIYQWYISGDDDNHEPLTDYAITHKLSAMGIPTPGESVGKTRIRESGMWAYSTVRRLLTSETYMGVFRYGRMGPYRKGEKRVPRPKDDLLVLDVPPIVSRDVWEAAEARREHNKRISGKKRYLLRGMITCGCGRKMAGQVHNPTPYYRCSCDKTYLWKIERERFDCHEKVVKADLIEAIVWNYVLDILTDPVRFEAEWRKVQDTERDSLAPKRDRLEVINDLIKHCEQEANETATALKKAKGLVLATLQAEMDGIDDRYAKLTTERDRLSAELQAGTQFDDEALAQALRFRADMIAGLKSPTFDDKRLYLEMLQVSVRVKDGRAIVQCALPIDPVELDLEGSKLTFVHSML
ncbi:hypothetical protein TFLX_05174 [Thermoflexales bacterium]|nr:hypothetical protein TFLX_05174 [Thermoflexales bacterium]